MDLEAVRMFIKVAELGSFTRTAEHLRTTKSRVSLAISALESEVGNRLLQRTTRVVRPTADGEQFLARAKQLIDEADDLSSMFQARRSLRGRVRVDMPVNIARELFIPALPEFLADHPQLELLLSTTDRRVELVREGFDLVLRIGVLADSGLTGKRLGDLTMMNLASPAYLQKHGVPRTIADLDDHLLVNYSLTLGAEPATFEYWDGSGYRERPMRSQITVNTADAYQSACLAGMGIIQTPRWGTLPRPDLVEILPEHPCAPMPVSLVHAHGRNVPKRVRAVMNWIEELIVPRLAQRAAAK